MHRIAWDTMKRLHDNLSLAFTERKLEEKNLNPSVAFVFRGRPGQPIQPLTLSPNILEHEMDYSATRHDFIDYETEHYDDVMDNEGLGGKEKCAT